MVLEFEEQGYIVVRNLYDVNNHSKKIPDLFEYTKKLISNWHSHKNSVSNDTQCSDTPSFYNEMEMSKIQIKLIPVLQKITGLELYPTYNYFRIYNKNSQLKPHVDRYACEISLSINIGYVGDIPWDLFLKDRNGKDVRVTLNPGDALIYRGCELEHWREDADENVILQTQLFMHYVDANGEHEDQIFDIIENGSFYEKVNIQ